MTNPPPTPSQWQSIAEQLQQELDELRFQLRLTTYLAAFLFFGLVAALAFR